MADPPETPQEAASREITALKEQAAPEVAGIQEKLSGAFWDKVKGFFASMFEQVWLDYREGAPDIFAKFIQAGVIFGAPVSEKNATQTIKGILDTESDPNVMLEKMEQFVEQFDGFDTVYKFVQFGVALWGMMSAGMSGQMEVAQQWVYKDTRPSMIPPEAAVDAVRKDPALEATVKEVLDRLGISDDLQEVLHTSANMPLSPADARSALLREFIDDTAFTDSLRANHFTDTDIETIKQLLQVLPPVQDIITMAVREVFSPDIVEKFGQMEGLPADFVKWAAQQGLSAEWASAYWAAHWSLPSVGQGFEMLHRAVISAEELEMLLRALDIMPFWRQRLTEISYRPLTRVDVRRMYALGVLTEEQVKRSYLDIGYNEDNAQLMTDFTVAFTTGAEKELTKGDIIALYKKYGIDGDTAQAMLMKLGYGEEPASLLVARATLEIYASYKKKQTTYLQRAYVAGKITESTAVGRLGALDMPASEINHLMDTWDLDRASKVRNLTVEQLKAMFTAKVITPEELRVELYELGYNEQDTARFVALFSIGGAA